MLSLSSAALANEANQHRALRMLKSVRYNGPTSNDWKRTYWCCALRHISIVSLRVSRPTWRRCRINNKQALAKAPISTGAERMRRHRQRRREGLRSLSNELSETEIDALIRAGPIHDDPEDQLENQHHE
jgi:hypothetical protein